MQNMVNLTTTTEPDTTETSTIPSMVYVDEEGLEEQFLMKDEASQKVADVTANRVTTPVDNIDVALLDPIYTQRSQQNEDLDLHPSRGPRGESLVNMMEEFLDDYYEDVLRTLNIQTNFSITTNNGGITGTPNLPLSWIVPDGTNRMLKKFAIRRCQMEPPGGGQSGAIVISLQRLEPYYGTQFFLLDLETGKVLAIVQQQWRHAGLYCSSQPFAVSELMNKVERTCTNHAS